MSFARCVVSKARLSLTGYSKNPPGFRRNRFSAFLIESARLWRSGKQTPGSSHINSGAGFATKVLGLVLQGLCWSEFPDEGAAVARGRSEGLRQTVQAAQPAVFKAREALLTGPKTTQELKRPWLPLSL